MLIPDTLRAPHEDRFLRFCSRAARWQILTLAALLSGGVVALDYIAGVDRSLGSLYMIPMVIAATVLGRPPIIAAAALLAGIRIALNPDNPGLFRFIMASAAYAAVGLFVSELVRNRRLIVRHLEEIHCQEDLRRETEQQLRLLAESSPAAIMTLDAHGRVLAANRAAHELLAFNGDGMIGEDIREYLPVLADAVNLDTGPSEFRTAAQCRGKRRNGELFLAHTWFSTYAAPGGRRLAAIAVDSSEEIRDREEQNLGLLLRSNRILAGAVSHDIRNLCGGIAVVHSNLRRIDGLQQNEDFRALGALVEALSQVASMEVRSRRLDNVGSVNLAAVVDLLRIIIEPAWQETGGAIAIEMPRPNLTVAGESSGLLQAFLNLAHNSHRAVQSASSKRLEVSVLEEGNRVLIRFRDSGPGVACPEKLFHPFQTGAEGSGMGLFVSRAIIRSYGGDLRYEEDSADCCFNVELSAARRAKANGV